MRLAHRAGPPARQLADCGACDPPMMKVGAMMVGEERIELPTDPV
jgi:hypothetical protein